MIEKNDPDTIFDPQINKLVTTSKDVKRVIHSQASNILTDGKKKPKKIPEWVKENYCFNTKNIDTTIWNNLVKKNR